MPRSMRLIKIIMVSTVALFFTLVSIDNWIDFQTNYLFVQHVTSMDTTFLSPHLMGRAITNQCIQRGLYYLIIGWEFITALVCWVGCAVMLVHFNAAPARFNRSKGWAFMGLFFGFLLYMVGFIIIGGEWFSMWQSTNWNGQRTAGLFVSLILFIMIFLHQGETE